jgi:hypothetical protein
MDKFVYGLAGSVVSGNATRDDVLKEHARTITEEELDAAILDLGAVTCEEDMTIIHCDWERTWAPEAGECHEQQV